MEQTVRVGAQEVGLGQQGLSWKGLQTKLEVDARGCCQVEGCGVNPERQEQICILE